MTSTLPHLTGPAVPPSSGGAPQQAVLFLHGYGADGNDLIGLASFFAQATPDAAFYSPNAPEPCETNPLGRQWFNLSTYDPTLMRRAPASANPSYAQMIEGAERAAASVGAFIEDVAARYALTMDRIALVGFSQGTMVALRIALQKVPNLAAVVGYSGALIGAETLAQTLIARPPVLLVHGESDPVAPFPAMAQTETALKALGVPVTAHARPLLGHGIDEAGIAHGASFLKTAFGLK